MDDLNLVHPADVFMEYFEPLNISQSEFCRIIGIDTQRLQHIIKKRVRVTSDIALRLSEAFDTTPEFWLDLQNKTDLNETRKKIKQELDYIKKNMAIRKQLTLLKSQMR